MGLKRKQDGSRWPSESAITIMQATDNSDSNHSGNVEVERGDRLYIEFTGKARRICRETG